MSPYVFVLCMDKLSYLIGGAVDNKQWLRIKLIDLVL